MMGLRNVNRSELVRKSIGEGIGLEKVARGRDRATVTEAYGILDELYEGVAKRYGAVRYDSARTVRSWMDQRYGASSWTHR